MSFEGTSAHNAEMEIRDALFGDLPLDQWPPSYAPSDPFPWTAFIEAGAHLSEKDLPGAITCWRKVLADPHLESRHYLQAWHFLRQHEEFPDAVTAKLVLGVVVEVAMPTGLDLVACYADHHARYYNYSGAGVAWEHPDDTLDSLINQVLTASADLVQRIGPWDGPRPPAPQRDHVRLSFLTPSGLHFGEGPARSIANDPLGGRVFDLATQLMQTLIGKHGRAQ